jgi:hypothetical protein
MSYLNPAIKEVYLKEPVSAKDLVQMLNGETLIGGRPQASPTNLEKNFHSALDYVFESASTSYISACVLDSSRVLVAYRDVGNSNYGTAIVLSISGTTITALSPAFVFESASTSYISACVLDSSRVLVAYCVGSNSGTAIVLSISGTTITAPSSAFVFESASTNHISACVLDSSRVLVAYQDVGNSSFGTAIVLSISGTTITAPSPAFVFESASTNYISACVLDSSRVLVAYRDSGNSSYGTARVLSISGTTITALSPAFVFESASTSYISACVLDSSRVLVAYRDGGNYDYGTAIVLSISGTTITAPSSAFVFKSAATTYISACVLGSSRVLVAYTDGGNFGYGKAIVLSMSNNDNLKYGIAITSGLQDTIIPVYIL